MVNMNWILDTLMVESTAFVEMDVGGGRRTEEKGGKQGEGESQMTPRFVGSTDRKMKFLLTAPI